MANYYTLFKITRDYFVTQKIYTAESSIYDKLAISCDPVRGGYNDWDDDN